jgi:hypothetical protein
MLSWFHLDKAGEISYYEIFTKATDFPYLSQEGFLALYSGSLTLGILGTYGTFPKEKLYPSSSGYRRGEPAPC